MSTIPEISPTELNDILDDDDLVLVDVREAHERELASLGGKHIPMNEMPKRIEELDSHREDTLVVYCRSGARSGQVVQYLRSMGFSKAINLKGGTNAWSRDVDPNLPTY